MLLTTTTEMQMQREGGKNTERNRIIASIPTINKKIQHKTHETKFQRTSNENDTYILPTTIATKTRSKFLVLYATMVYIHNSAAN